MREIKFRVWDKDLKIMMPNIQNQHCETINAELRSFRDVLKHPSLELMQYTGLKDKNGTEIYEGDILDVDTENRIVKVVWFKPQACFDTDVIRIIDKAWPFFQALRNAQWNYRCEVIGNIYENEELLNE